MRLYMGQNSVTQEEATDWYFATLEEDNRIMEEAMKNLDSGGNFTLLGDYIEELEKRLV